MNIRFQTALLFVKNISASRTFYEKVLQQKVKYDFGEDVVFDSGFAIHNANHISNLLFNRPNPYIQEKLGKENLELYFECDDLDEIFSVLNEAGVILVHNIKEQPWGQRVLRFYDPDYHIVEIGEPMTAVIRRFLEMGLPEAEVAQKTSMPLEEVLKNKSDIDKIN